MIKALFVISYIRQVAYLVINFSLCWTPLSLFFFFFRSLRTNATSFKPEKQCLYPSRRASGALLIIMICMGVQEISVGVYRFVVWLWLVKWNIFSFSIREFHCWYNFGEKKKKKKKERKWGRKLFLMYKLSMFIIPPKIPRKGFVYTWYIQRWKLLNGVIGFTCLIYLSLSWFIFASLVSMAFELHFQIFPTLILKPHYNP